MLLNDLFTQLRVAQIERLVHPEEGTTYYLHLESMDSDMLACRVAIPGEIFDRLERTGEPWPAVEDIGEIPN